MFPCHYFETLMMGTHLHNVSKKEQSNSLNEFIEVIEFKFSVLCTLTEGNSDMSLVCIRG